MNNRPSLSLLTKMLLIIGMISVFGTINPVSSQEVPRKILLSLPFKSCWTKSLDKTSKIDLASDNVSNLLLFSSQEKITAVKSDSGEKLWEVVPGGEIRFVPLFDVENKSIYVATILPKYDKSDVFEVKIKSLSKITGITNWVANLTTESTNILDISVFVHKNELIISDRHGKLTALDSSGGDVLWNKKLDSELSESYVSLQSESLVIATDSRVFLVSPETGIVTYQRNIDSRITSAYIYNKNILITGNEKGEIRAINTDTRQNYWKSRYGGQISNIITTNKGVLITSFDNFIYLILPESGKEVWKVRLSGRLIFEPYIIDNFAVVIILGSSQAVIIDINTGKPVNQINLKDDDFFVNKPIVINDVIIFPTNRGLIAFMNSDNKCYS